MLAPMSTGGQERHMAVDLILQVSRSADNRLSGTVSVTDGRESRAFSGTLELMRAFEELVPVAPSASESLDAAESG
jgi:hypothetical protein